MGSFLSDTYFKSFSRTVNMFISIFMIQVLQQLNFWWYRQKLYLLANRKKIVKFLMRTVTCPSIVLYVANLWLSVSASAEMFEQAGEARARAHTFHVDSGSELDTWLVHPSKQSTCTQHRHSYHQHYHRVMSQANVLVQKRKVQEKNRLLEARIETKMLISLFSRYYEDLKLWLSVTSFPAKYSGKRKLSQKLAKIFLQDMAKKKKIA